MGDLPTEPAVGARGRAPRVLIFALLAQIIAGSFFVYLASRDFDWFTPDAVEQRPSKTAATSAAAAAVMPRAKVDRFDGARSFALLREQVETYGPRPAGSPALRRLGDRLVKLLPNGRFEAVPGHPGLRNVVGRLPGTKPAVVIAAHYDTKEEPEGLLGANDAAGGTAGVVELARSLRRIKRPRGAPELRFVLFDGEEAPKGCPDFERCGIRGSKAYVKRHAKQVGGLILLDFIAEKGTRIPREANSDVELWAKLRRAARRVGVGVVFPAGPGPDISDDHTPFLRRGIPAIDLIDFDFDEWHTLEDDLDVVSEDSLDAVGEAVVELVRGFRSGRL